MAAIIWLIFMAVASFIAYAAWRSGQIAAFPQTRRERLRLLWVVIFVINFLAFIAHGFRDGASAFFGTGRLVDGHYLVVEHGRQVSFTPGGYWFNYWHSVVFLVVFIACAVAIGRLKRSRDSTSESDIL
jgi:hypothetical protein